LLRWLLAAPAPALAQLVPPVLQALLVLLDLLGLRAPQALV
jgi:hypothetical protein